MKNQSHAKELVKVKGTIICMVHFLADEHCNVSKYPDWYAEFERASQPMVQVKENITSFSNFKLQGNHDDAKKLWYNWDFKVDDKLGSWFEAMWFHLEASSWIRCICKNLDESAISRIAFCIYKPGSNTGAM